MLRSSPLATLALLTSATLAQTVHLVGPGGLPQIHSAIAIAQPGDVIEVQTGIYAPFTLQQALTIRAAPGSTVTILPVSIGSVIIQPPAGTVAVMQGIRVINPWQPFFGSQVEVNSGTVYFEDCIFESSNQYLRAPLEVTDAAVVLTRCTLAGFGATRGAVGAQNDGLRAINATVHATDCAFFGSYTTFDSYGLGGNGMTAIASDVHLVRCQLVGGSMYLSFANPGGVGLESRNSRVWLADCQVDGGNTPGLYGHQVGINNTGPPVQWARSKIQGGQDQNGSRVAAFNGPQTVTPLLGLDATPPGLTRGSQFTVDFNTAPNWPIWLFVSGNLATSVHPAITQSLAVDPLTAGLLGMLTADAAGQATYQTTVPNFPAILGERLHVTAISGTALPLQAMPPIGGVIR